MDPPSVLSHDYWLQYVDNDTQGTPKDSDISLLIDLLDLSQPLKDPLDLLEGHNTASKDEDHVATSIHDINHAKRIAESPVNTVSPMDAMALQEPLQHSPPDPQPDLASNLDVKSSSRCPRWYLEDTVVIQNDALLSLMGVSKPCSPTVVSSAVKMVVVNLSSEAIQDLPLGRHSLILCMSLQAHGLDFIKNMSFSLFSKGEVCEDFKFAMSDISVDSIPAPANMVRLRIRHDFWVDRYLLSGNPSMRIVISTNDWVDRDISILYELHYVEWVNRQDCAPDDHILGWPTGLLQAIQPTLLKDGVHIPKKFDAYAISADATVVATMFYTEDHAHFDLHHLEPLEGLDSSRPMSSRVSKPFASVSTPIQRNGNDDVWVFFDLCRDGSRLMVYQPVEPGVLPETDRCQLFEMDTSSPPRMCRSDAFASNKTLREFVGVGVFHTIPELRDGEGDTCERFVIANHSTLFVFKTTGNWELQCSFELPVLEGTMVLVKSINLMRGPYFMWIHGTELQIRGFQTGEIVFSVPLGKDPELKAEISWDGSLLAVANISHRTISLYRTATGDRLQVFKSPELYALISLTFIEDNQKLLARIKAPDGARWIILDCSGSGEVQRNQAKNHDSFVLVNIPKTVCWVLSDCWLMHGRALQDNGTTIDIISLKDVIADQEEIHRPCDDNDHVSSATPITHHDNIHASTIAETGQQFEVKIVHDALQKGTIIRVKEQEPSRQGPDEFVIVSPSRMGNQVGKGDLFDKFQSVLMLKDGRHFIAHGKHSLQLWKLPRDTDFRFHNCQLLLFWQVPQCEVLSENESILGVVVCHHRQRISIQLRSPTAPLGERTVQLFYSLTRLYSIENAQHAIDSIPALLNMCALSEDGLYSVAVVLYLRMFVNTYPTADSLANSVVTKVCQFSFLDFASNVLKGLLLASDGCWIPRKDYDLHSNPVLVALQVSEAFPPAALCAYTILEYCRDRTELGENFLYFLAPLVQPLPKDMWVQRRPLLPPQQQHSLLPQPSQKRQL